MKTCTKCKEIKLLSEFYQHSKQRSCLYSVCKECSRAISRQWYANNKEKSIAVTLKWYTDNHDRAIKNKRKWRSENLEKVRTDLLKWRTENPDKVRTHLQASSAKRLGSLKGKLSSVISSSINKSLRGSKAGRHWESLVGYTLNDLMQHLEKQFKPGMAWKNHGIYWHIDHKIPIAVFNFEKPEHIDFKRCWALENLQPLEAIDNRRKGMKLTKPFQPSLTI